MKLNADVGEGCASDKLVIGLVDQAMVACDCQSGDRHSIRQAVQLCIDSGTDIVARPSYPDGKRFGIGSASMAREELFDILLSQVMALAELCEELGANVVGIKPHGSLYRDMMSSNTVFETILSVASRTSLNLFVPPLFVVVNGAQCRPFHIFTSDRYNVPLVREAFIDRTYNADGSLVPRADAGAVITHRSEIVERFNGLLKKRMVSSFDAKRLKTAAKTLCFDPQNQSSLIVLKQIRAKRAR